MKFKEKKVAKQRGLAPKSSSRQTKKGANLNRQSTHRSPLRPRHRYSRCMATRQRVVKRLHGGQRITVCGAFWPSIFLKLVATTQTTECISHLLCLISSSLLKEKNSSARCFFYLFLFVSINLLLRGKSPYEFKFYCSCGFPFTLLTT